MMRKIHALSILVIVFGISQRISFCAYYVSGHPGSEFVVPPFIIPPGDISEHEDISEHDDLSPNDESICSICIDTLEVPGAQDAVVTLACDHKFHFNCIVDWALTGSNLCPLCRKPDYSLEGVRTFPCEHTGNILVSFYGNTRNYEGSYVGGRPYSEDSRPSNLYIINTFCFLRDLLKELVSLSTRICSLDSGSLSLDIVPHISTALVTRVELRKHSLVSVVVVVLSTVFLIYRIVYYTYRALNSEHADMVPSVISASAIILIHPWSFGLRHVLHPLGALNDVYDNIILLLLGFNKRIMVLMLSLAALFPVSADPCIYDDYISIIHVDKEVKQAPMSSNLAEFSPSAFEHKSENITAELDERAAILRTSIHSAAAMFLLPTILISHCSLFSGNTYYLRTLVIIPYRHTWLYFGAVRGDSQGWFLFVPAFFLFLTLAGEDVSEYSAILHCLFIITHFSALAGQILASFPYAWPNIQIHGLQDMEISSELFELGEYLKIVELFVPRVISIIDFPLYFFLFSQYYYEIQEFSRSHAFE